MPNVLIIGATRGLGASLAKAYASAGVSVFGTTRSSSKPEDFGVKEVQWLLDIDLMKPTVGQTLTTAIAKLKPEPPKSFDVVIITAGYFKTETLKSPNFEDQQKMYTTSAIAPTLLVSSLHASHHLTKGTKVILVSSESGSVTLRHESEGGGNYGHHASKAALNMVGRLLSLDLEDQGVVVSIVHPGFMRTDMTKGVGFDQFYEEGGAVTPDVAAESLVRWVETLDMTKTGEYWAPRGPRDIGTAEKVLGKNIATPFHLPW
ncbi:hypothetical protein HKX48_001946 [Thoreauomyces humboldtii]|nr:hypothetical protein HKX48_001946 [Thoreauomyces humboldtii]